MELGVSPNLFIKDLSSIFNIEIGILIDKSLLNIMIEKNNVSIDDKYTLIRGSDHLKKHLNESPMSSHFRANMDIVLQNHISKTLGLLILGFNISDIEDKNRDFMYKLIYMGIFVALLLVTVLHMGFK